MCLLSSLFLHMPLLSSAVLAELCSYWWLLEVFKSFSLSFPGCSHCLHWHWWAYYPVQSGINKYSVVTSDSAFTWFHHLVRTFSFKHAVFCNGALQGWWQRSHPSPSWCFLLLWPFADKGDVFISKAPLLLADFCLENENIFITFVFIRIFSSSIHNITSRNRPEWLM